MKLNRRDLLKMGGAALLGAGSLRHGAAASGCGGGEVIEVFPTSPMIVSPFTDELPIPRPLAPSDPTTWAIAPRPNEHQIWPNALGLPEPVYYKIPLQVSEHRFTSSLVQPVNQSGQPVAPPGAPNANPRPLPASTIYGFNGTFPGPMIYAQYGRPCFVRFENRLDENPLLRDRGDFGSPDLKFLTHLHNGHTAPESDGNPNHRPQAYSPGEYMDSLYLNWAAGGDQCESQSFLWFHDHTHDHTGANVYKGMVGLYPVYSKNDEGDERRGWRLPGVKNASTGCVDYDIPLALYDCCLDDGVTQHKDFHNGCGETHPEWWGQTFFRHFPNHGFVGDLFTVNGKAYPVMEVKRRKYRLRFLGASVARIYDLSLMAGDWRAAPGTQGQFLLPNGHQCMRMTQIAADGGLLPAPIVRDSFQIWPAKRKEVIVDFSRYMDGTPTKKGDVVYLTNTLKMTDGRKPDSFDPNYKVPLMKFVIGDDAPDLSIIPPRMRALPPVPWNRLDSLTHRTFKLERSGGGESQWMINGRPFEPTAPLAFIPKGSEEVWTFENGGGWVHPLHIHQEEHQVLSRNGVAAPSPGHPDDKTKEDVIAVGESEKISIYRRFRTFTGGYVCHCHNLAHEDHAMMFGWNIV